MAPAKKKASASPAKRGRGRPPKNGVAKKTEAATPAKRARGRPPSAGKAASKTATTNTKTSASVAQSPRRGRGRPKSTAKQEESKAQQLSPDPDPLPQGHARYKTLDVFTTEKYQGNPLAVVTLPPDRYSKQSKQALAKEFNYSETTFVTGDKESGWRVDIFTPYEELPFAGHPTIGTICALAMDDLSLKQGKLFLKAGLSEFRVTRSGPGRSIITAAAEIPHEVHVHTMGLEAGLLETSQPDLSRYLPPDSRPNEWPMVSITKGMTFVLVEVPSMEALSEVKTTRVDVASQVTLDWEWSPSFVGSYFYFVERSEAEGREQIIHSRMIEKDFGEDAVTGSAACALSAFLALDLFGNHGFKDSEFEITQGEHFGRSGTVSVRVAVDDDGKVETMHLKGEAVRVMSGTVDMA